MSCKTSTSMATSRKEGEKPGVMVIVKETEVPEQTGTKDETEEMPGREHRPPRSAAVQDRAHLDKYHKLHASVRDLADVGTVPASVLLRRKHPAAQIQPTSQK